MANFEQYDKVLATSKDNQGFKLCWEHIADSEAKHNSPDNIRLRNYVEDLARGIISDCVDLTDGEICLMLTEGTPTAHFTKTYEPNYSEIELGWKVNMTSAGYNEALMLAKQEHSKHIVGINTLYYTMTPKKDSFLSYCRVFRIDARWLLPNDGVESKGITTMSRLMRLAASRYQQCNCENYSEWLYSYLGAPHCVASWNSF